MRPPKLKATDAVHATRRSVKHCFLRIYLAVALAIIFERAVVAAAGNPAEEFVTARVAAGEIADLRESADRKLTVQFLQGLLTGTPRHRHGVRIIGATLDEPIDLVNALIPCEVSLTHCQFNKPITFVRARFAGVVNFSDSTFRSEVTFSGAEVGADAFFNGTVFEDSVRFTAAKIVGRLSATGAKFKNKEKPTVFNSMNVRHAFFDDAVFEGPADFSLADIIGNFQVRRAKFQNKPKGVDFHAMQCGARALFTDAVSEGPVNLSYADFGWLELPSSFWPKAATQFQVQGMSYRYISAVPDNEAESHRALLRLADRAAYTGDVYSNLEAFFLRQGYRRDADEAFIRGKRRERKENLDGYHWLGSWLLDKLIGYGRRPLQAAIPCAVLIALGCVLFSPDRMERQKVEDAPRVYSRFWYSLGLFLPFVDLQADNVWKPKEDQTFLRHYMRMHILLGWILIPIVLAALTGLIK